MSAKTFLAKQNYLKELTVLEHIVLWFNIVSSLIFFIVQLCFGAWVHATTWLSFAASTISIFAVMAGAKQRILCPFLGLIATAILIPFAWMQNLYGSMIMYGFNAVVNVSSLVTWIRSSKNKVSIEPKHAKSWVVIVYLLFFIGLTALFTWVEGVNGFAQFWSGNPSASKQPLEIRIFDSANLMFTIACLIPMIKRYDQVWYTYIIADISICLTYLIKGIEAAGQTFDMTIFSNWTMFISGLCMTITCFIGLFNWKKTTSKHL